MQDVYPSNFSTGLKILIRSVISQTEFPASDRKELTCVWHLGELFFHLSSSQTAPKQKKELKVLTLTQQYLKSVVQLLHWHRLDVCDSYYFSFYFLEVMVVLWFTCWSAGRGQHVSCVVALCEIFERTCHWQSKFASFGSNQPEDYIGGGFIVRSSISIWTGQ